MIGPGKSIDNICQIESFGAFTLSGTEIETFRSLVGKPWLSSQTRPDITFCAKRLLNTDGMTTKLANKAVRRKQYEKDQKIKLRRLFTGDNIDFHKMKLAIFSDAAFQNVPDGGSQYI